MKYSTRIPIALAIACSLLTLTALAEHEVDHRYEVAGYVLDADEKPVANSPVVIRMNDSVIARGETDSDGSYLVRMHLHDEDLGENLQVKTAQGEATIRVSFTRGDANARRIHYANFVSGEFVEGELGKRVFPLWIFGVVAVLAIIPVGRLIAAKVKRQRKKSSHESAAKQPRKRKPKKRRR